MADWSNGFEARARPERLAQATLYLPTRRAGRMAREIFLDVLQTDAVVLPRIVALGDIDEDEAGLRGGVRTIRRGAAAGHSTEARRTRAQAHAGKAGRGLGQDFRCRRRLLVGGHGIDAGAGW